MKKYIIFLFLSVILLVCCGCLKKEVKKDDLETIKERGYLIVGVKQDSPPFGYYKNGKLTGIDIEISKNIASAIFKSDLPDKIKFVRVDAQNRISKLNSKEVDILVATMSVNEKRKLVIDFSMPYFIASQKLMVRKNSNIKSIYYFNKNGRLGVVLGTTGEKILHYIAPNARITGAKTYGEAIGLLNDNQIDGIIGDDCILEGYNNAKFKILSKAYSRENYAVALRKSENSKELLNVVNTAIASILDDNKLNISKNGF